MALGRTRTDSAPVDLRIPFAASSVPAVRHRLRRWMLDHDAAMDRVDEARIVLSEMVGNAVRHARPLPGGDLRVGWRLDAGRLRLFVTDGGGLSRPHAVEVPLSSVSGRGMLIVESLASSWWVERAGQRTTVIALLALRERLAG